MTKFQLRELFLSHYGESSRLARELALSRTTVSRWFRGHVSSRRLEDAIRNRAQQLLEREIGKLFERVDGDFNDQRPPDPN